MYSITHEDLLRLILYIPETGKFYYRVDRGNFKAGKEIEGSSDKDGYLVCKINRKMYKLHRLAWFYMTGDWPDKVDHKDTIKYNNIWTNLRNSSCSQNAHNVGLLLRNTSGVKGLSFSVTHGGSCILYLARVTCKGKQRRRYFRLDQEQEAIRWLQNTRKELHGEFKNDG